MSVLILAAILIGASSQAAQSRSLPLTEEQIQSLDPVGSCEGNGRSIDLHRVMFLENRTIDIDGPNGPLRISIERDSFYAEEIGGSSLHRRHYSDISSEVDEGSDLDIELKLAYYEGRLVLYWKETFLNRHYRQGLFSIVGPVVRFLCAGQGGRHAVR